MSLSPAGQAETATDSPFLECLLEAGNGPLRGLSVRVTFPDEAQGVLAVGQGHAGAHALSPSCHLMAQHTAAQRNGGPGS